MDINAETLFTVVLVIVDEARLMEHQPTGLLNDDGGDPIQVAPFHS